MRLCEEEDFRGINIHYAVKLPGLFPNFEKIKNYFEVKNGLGSDEHTVFSI